jgi:hypothetical protein
MMIGRVCPSALPDLHPALRLAGPARPTGRSNDIELLVLRHEVAVRGEPVKVIAARIGQSYQSLYREIARNSKPGGRYQPWYAHGQAHLRRRRPRVRVFEGDAGLAGVVAGRLGQRWSPGQISRWLRRRYPRRPDWHVCTETIYEAVCRGLIVPVSPGCCAPPAPTGTAAAAPGTGRCVSARR